MELLKDQSGYSLIETLVCISLLGIILFISTSVFVRLFANPKILVRNEALFIANEEITRATQKKEFKDTTYTNENANLTIERRVIESGEFAQIEVYVRHSSQSKEIVKLSASIRR